MKYGCIMATFSSRPASALVEGIRPGLVAIGYRTTALPACVLESGKPAWRGQKDAGYCAGRMTGCIGKLDVTAEAYALVNEGRACVVSDRISLNIQLFAAFRPAEGFMCSLAKNVRKLL